MKKTDIGQRKTLEVEQRVLNGTVFGKKINVYFLHIPETKYNEITYIYNVIFYL